jgi:hypothetical protein
MNRTSADYRIHVDRTVILSKWQDIFVMVNHKQWMELSRM